jgi:hypothetical protein
MFEEKFNDFTDIQDSNEIEFVYNNIFKDLNILVKFLQVNIHY